MENDIELDIDLSFDEDDEEDELDLDFDIGDFSFLTDEEETVRIMKPRMPETARHHKVKFDNALKLAESLDLSPGARTTCIVPGNFIMGDLIEALILDRKMDVKSIYINTLSMSQENIDSLRTILNLRPRLEKLNVLLSAYFYSHEKYKLVKYLYDELDIDNRLQVSFMRTHCKIYLIETHKGNQYVISGSANLRSSANIEQFEIENNPELFEFYKTMFDNILKKYPTINYKVGKPVKGVKAWQAVAQAEAAQK